MHVILSHLCVCTYIRTYVKISIYLYMILVKIGKYITLL